MAMDSDATAIRVEQGVSPARQSPGARKLIKWGRKNPVGVAGLVLISVLLAMAFLAGVASPHEPNRISGGINESPSAEHYLGDGPHWAGHLHPIAPWCASLPQCWFLGRCS